MLIYGTHTQNISLTFTSGLPWWLSGKESVCQCRRQGFDPGSRRSPEEGNGNSFQYPCLGNPMNEEPDGLYSMELQKS